ncbi:MAG: hypothetical protein EON58_01725 [Alphaproteobacteria bacterium]|nr:MAG: hypothetical protein EON58_01725 [Alphaproteobacteria bacterium]
MKEDQMKFCDDCVKDPILFKEIRDLNHQAQCDFCGEHGFTIDIETLSERVEGVINDHYERHWDERGADEGQPVRGLIAELTRTNEKLADTIGNFLEKKHRMRIWSDGDPNPFDGEACYQETPIDESEFHGLWDGFQREIRHRARFFSKQAKSYLEEIFDDVAGHRTWRNEPVIIEAGPGTDMPSVYRARVSLSADELRAILIDPVRQLGAPPTNLAKAGRMNPKGISMFYGAAEEETCIAEVRAPVGSDVVIGQFVFTRPIRLLDLDRFSMVYTSKSFFDPEFTKSAARAHFLKRLGKDISRPIMPRDEEDEYLVTQAVAEYLAANVASLDGLIFASAQTGQEGKNIVLFHHASKAEPYDLPASTEVTVRFGSFWDDDDDGTAIQISEKVPAGKVTTARHVTESAGQPAFNLTGWENDANIEVNLVALHEPYLRLDISSIKVLRVRAVKYSKDRRSINRSRELEEDRAQMNDPTCFNYFAYGSNMSSARLRFRVPNCRVVAVATLVGHELRFHKASKDDSAKCDAYRTGDLSNGVVGVVFAVPVGEKPLLDKAEGQGNGYDDVTVNLIANDGSAIEAVTYIASQNSIDASLHPYAWYKDFVSTGAEEHKLPRSYIETFIDPIQAVADPDPAREKKRRQEVAPNTREQPIF